MAQGIITDTYLTNIANAIRNKNGLTDTYKPSEMAQAINEIPSGGGGINSTGWIDAYLTQDNTTYSTSATGTSYTITPNTQWNINGHTAYILDPSLSISQSFYLLYNGRNTQMTMGMGMTPLNLNSSYYFIKEMDYRDITNLPRFGGTFYQSTSKYMYRLRPLIYTPTDYTITEDTKMDVILIISVGSTTYDMKASFKYRLYEPMDMSGKTYKDEEDNPLANVSSVSLNKSTSTITEGSSETLTATVSPNNAICKDVNWSTNNNVMISLNNGAFTGNYEGSAIITATSIADNTKSANCNITVNSSLSDVYQVPNDLTPKTYGSYTVTRVDNHLYMVSQSMPGPTPSEPTPFTGQLSLYTEGNYTSKLTVNHNTGWQTYTRSDTSENNYILSPYYGSYSPQNYAGAFFTVPTGTTEIKIKNYQGHIFIKCKYTGVDYPQGYVNTGLSFTTWSDIPSVDSENGIVTYNTPLEEYDVYRLDDYRVVATLNSTEWTTITPRAYNKFYIMDKNMTGYRVDFEPIDVIGLIDYKAILSEDRTKVYICYKTEWADGTPSLPTTASAVVISGNTLVFPSGTTMSNLKAIDQTHGNISICTLTDDWEEYTVSGTSIIYIAYNIPPTDSTRVGQFTIPTTATKILTKYDGMTVYLKYQ